MRHLLLIALVLLLVTHTTIQTNAPAAGTSCTTINPFRAIIPAGAISYHKKPVMAQNVCGFEFGIYGTCCDTTQLVNFAKQEEERTRKDVVTINREVVHLHQLAVRIFGLVQKMAHAPLHPKRKDWNDLLRAAQSVWPTFAPLEKIASLPIADKYPQASTACWQYVLKARDVALCYTCSGRSAHFFKSDKALIDESTCETFVRKCGSSLTGMVALIKGLNFLVTQQASLQKIGISLNLTDKVNHGIVTIVHRVLVSEKIDNTIESAATKPDLGHKTNVCNRFFKLRETPIVTILRQMVTSNEAPWVLKELPIEAYLKEVEAEIQAKIAEIKSGPQTQVGASQTPQQNTQTWRIARLLQFSSKQVDFNSDAKIVDSHDPSYTSVGVSGNSPMELNHSFP